ncbi:MAG: neutral/alkaline non-lysosomal ceramidase N-terminal domain-containing protein [Verrucomicrobiota bacterium]|nr:neutral/alkaline non-lysosomal ceramidase N-terminal domain-containing protein [Verrucomicrobiota bacterium]
MKTTLPVARQVRSASRMPATIMACTIAVASAIPAVTIASEPPIEVGIASRDVTPDLPIWLAGYAARNRPADKIDHPLAARAIAFRDQSDQSCVLVAVDNCEVSAEFAAPALKSIQDKHGLNPGQVIIVSSHSHSTPVLEGPLNGMYPLGPAESEQIKNYGDKLRAQIVEVVGAALADLAPARIEHGIGRCTFAMNRRAFTAKDVVIGENPDGPVDWDVPVLRITGTNGTVRAIVFGYACHATTVHGDDFYTVTPDFPGYARAHLESVYPGATAIFLTGMGADCNPSPRGSLLTSKGHGLELAGAVAGVLNHPMRDVTAPIQFSYATANLPLEAPPAREKIEQDAQSRNQYIRHRAAHYLSLMDKGGPLPAVQLPIAVLRFGNRLTLMFMGGEVVVDYARKLKRVFAEEHPWTIGYAYDVPCYIPSARVVKEGGYESDSSMIYYCLYGPFKPAVEDVVMDSMTKLLTASRATRSVVMAP